MHAKNAQPNWQSHTKLQHWIKHSLVPVTLMVVFLWLPKPWTLTLFQPNSVIEIELIESQQLFPATATIETVNQPLVEPAIKQPNESRPKLEEKMIKPTLKKIAKIKIESMPQEIITSKQTTASEVNAGDVFKMIQDRTSNAVPIEFQARTQPASDFYIPEQEIRDWMADIPFLDESVDKPKLQMNFYAEGIEGGIEKFFDKITISKTFTTKYGTKIHCALIGIIATCGWK